MLETKDLVKIYKPKKGVPVTALNKVSLKFPEKGMVFLLGKSGSGKSTLLNVLGGLDNYNGGEIIIRGVSSKNFRQKHFDSYRNTYVGFIFQEYNVLDEFTVGANIALAIELQNRKATDEQINDILKQVDLAGYGKRKPNELSGGQKQRVAIARALVKNPHIIMADEPTGALDSNTGRQVLETLKRLSSEKLVIVVSHDREFAEAYADRIIELADGVVISDVERCGEKQHEGGISYNGDTIELTDGYHLTEQDRIQINEYIDSIKNGIKIKASLGTKNFKETDQSKIKSQDGSAFKLIKSRLPLKNAFKIGAGGLKHKKIRLAITILLSCIAFGLFGLADTFAAYNHIKVCTNSLIDTKVKYIATAKSKKIGSGVNEYWRNNGYLISDKEIKEINKEASVAMQGVFEPIGNTLGFSTQVNPDKKLTETDFSIYRTYFSGFAPISEDIIGDMGFKLLAGRLPSEEGYEIAISEYILEVFKRGMYTDGILIKGADGKEALKYEDILSYDDILGKTLVLNNQRYTVTAVIDTNFELERYEDLTVIKEYSSGADELVDYVLFNEFDYAVSYSYSSLAMVNPVHLSKIISERPPMSNITEGYISFHHDYINVDSNYLAKLGDVAGEKILWIDGEREVLGEKEIIATLDTVHIWYDGEENKHMVFNENGEIDYIATLKKNNDISAWREMFNDPDSQYKNDDGYKIVGIIDNQIGNSENANASDSKNNSRLISTVVCSDKLFEQMTEGKENYYKFCVGALPEGKEEIKDIVSFCYRDDINIRYQIKNSVTYELDAINESLNAFSKVFLYIGLGFALFAALMLSNFIGTSISYKKQEIGILRAIGSRSNDVFRIFFCESFVIAVINFLLSAMGVGVATAVINYIIRNELGILVTVLSFDIRQILLLFAASVLVALAASFIPVKRIAAKRPIDAIRDR